MEIELDQWQKDVLNTSGNIVLRSGRQVGKSTVISIKAAEYAIKYPKRSIMIISATERQAYLLFSKVLAYIHDTNKKLIMKGKKRPTKSEINLVNGSIIRCLPTGMDGLGIRGYTVDLLIADEAAFIPEDVWPALTPMLSTTGGNLILLSTPFGRSGYFYDCFNDDRYVKFHVNAEVVAESRKEPQRSNMLANLKAEQKRMTVAQYAQEYLGEFLDELRQVFPDQLIKKCMTKKRRETIVPDRTYFLGVDVARMGEDESTFEIIDRTDREMLKQVENIVTTKTLTTETTQLIISLHDKYKFKKIYIDDGGLGVAVFDSLLVNTSTRNKVVALNNAARSLDKDDEKRKKIMKEDLYMNLLHLMEMGKIQLLDDPEIFQSLKSCQFELDEVKKRLRIFGNYTHIAEGLIRAAWCYRDKSLNIWVR